MKPELYREVCDRLHRLLGEENDFIANASNTSALLFQSVPDITWAGLYIARGSDLVLGPFQGKPACARIPLGKGVCGTAAVEHRSVIVPDVSRFPGHIVCDPDARSEIAVPLLSWGRLIGVLDLDSATLNRFDEDDREGLESIAAILLASATGSVPDLDEQAKAEEANSLS
jgi:GAF domain-containing protein